jgi:hypothetical protein
MINKKFDVEYCFQSYLKNEGLEGSKQIREAFYAGYARMFWVMRFDLPDVTKGDAKIGVPILNDLTKQLQHFINEKNNSN